MNIALYCSSAEELPPYWQQAAAAVGQWIGLHGATLVYGGVDAGLMRVAARECKSAGGNVVGIVPQRRNAMASPLNDVRIPASDLNDRKAVMQLLADIFVVLPGGYGTLDEFATSFAYINFTNRTDKPIILFNPDNIYGHLLAQLDEMARHGLMRPQAAEILHTARSIEELTGALDRFYSTDPENAQ